MIYVHKNSPFLFIIFLLILKRKEKNKSVGKCAQTLQKSWPVNENVDIGEGEINLHLNFKADIKQKSKVWNIITYFIMFGIE